MVMVMVSISFGSSPSPWNVRHKALLGGPEIYKEGAGEDRGAVLRQRLASGVVLMLEENSRHLKGKP